MIARARTGWVRPAMAGAAALVLGTLLVLLLARAAEVPGLDKPPRWIQLPIDRWIGQGFDGFLAVSLGGVTVVDLFRGLTSLFGIPVAPALAGLGALSLRPAVVLLGLGEVTAVLPAVLVGFNQVVMMSLAMVAIASLIGAGGLGHEVLVQLDRLSPGRALEVGVGIVVLAVTLDRIGSGIANRPAGAARSRAQRQGTKVLFAAAALAAVLQALHVTGFDAIKGFLSTAPMWDRLISGFVAQFSDQLETFRNQFPIWFALPIRQALPWLPWPGMILAAAAGACWLGGTRLTLLALVTLGGPAIGGLWVPAVSTVYMVLTAQLICLAIGVPVAVAVSRHAGLSRAALLVCWRCWQTAASGRSSHGKEPSFDIISLT